MTHTSIIHYTFMQCGGNNGHSVWGLIWAPVAQSEYDWCSLMYNPTLISTWMQLSAFSISSWKSKYCYKSHRSSHFRQLVKTKFRMSNSFLITVYNVLYIFSLLLGVAICYNQICLLNVEVPFKTHIPKVRYEKEEKCTTILKVHCQKLYLEVHSILL